MIKKKKKGRWWKDGCIYIVVTIGSGHFSRQVAATDVICAAATTLVAAVVVPLFIADIQLDSWK